MAAPPPLPPGVDRSAPPPAGSLKPFRFPHFLRTRLPNGLAVLAARHSELPLVSLEMLMPAGGQYDPEGESGLSSLTAAVLDEGTRRRSAMDIAAAAERLGGYFATGADWDVGFLATGLLAENRADALELLADVAFHPTFPTAEVERLQRQRLAEILRRTQDPSALADDRYHRVLYDGTPYAHPLIGEEGSLAALGREALVDFYQRHYGLDGAVLIAVGDFDP
ncbi:MAG TPA: pitrilysin family protein, partial [Thermoanaerobaculia bacterium]|nr:pitrilysin family protein [Thermoanaerobaculia bacterium]